MGGRGQVPGIGWTPPFFTLPRVSKLRALAAFARLVRSLPLTSARFLRLVVAGNWSARPPAPVRCGASSWCGSSCGKPRRWPGSRSRRSCTGSRGPGPDGRRAEVGGQGLSPGPSPTPARRCHPALPCAFVVRLRPIGSHFGGLVSRRPSYRPPGPAQHPATQDDFGQHAEGQRSKMLHFSPCFNT